MVLLYLQVLTPDFWSLLSFLYILFSVKDTYLKNMEHMAWISLRTVALECT